MQNRNTKDWKKIKGFEGPLFYPNGVVIYYDPKEEKYYDPLTDYYIAQGDIDFLNNLVFDLIRG